MIRLAFLVEGLTEQQFVDGLLRGHLEALEIYSTTKRLEGMTTFQKLVKEHRLFLRDRSFEARFTTMFDYYKLPRHFPAVSDVQPRDPVKHATALEQRFTEEINDRRFVPYIQVHEFEALIFTDISKLTKYYSEHRGAIEELERVRQRFATPEHIDDDPQTAPSKRILSNVPGYDKPYAGSLTAIDIGLAALRAACPHFSAWVERLEILK